MYVFLDAFPSTLYETYSLRGNSWETVGGVVGDTHTHTHTYTVTLTHSHTLTHAHTLTLTRSHTYTHTHQVISPNQSVIQRAVHWPISDGQPAGQPHCNGSANFLEI